MKPLLNRAFVQQLFKTNSDVSLSTGADRESGCNSRNTQLHSFWEIILHAKFILVII